MMELQGERPVFDLTADAKRAADRLYSHLISHHLCEDGSLVGPDPGVGFNLRIGRFVKSYLAALPWRDRLYYLQAQAYWIMDNIELSRSSESRYYVDRTVRCADAVLSRQTPEGYWEYPQAEWRGRVATVEGCFGALSLLLAHRHNPNNSYLTGAERWYDFMVERVGFQSMGEGALAVNYFSNTGRGLVPNNSTLALWFVAELAEVTGCDRYLRHAPAMIEFLARAQLDTGELPYVIGSEQGPGRVHYLCFQYNAFQFLDLVQYYRIFRDDTVLSIMRQLAKFLSTGLTNEGDARHDCTKNGPNMHYFTAAVAAALWKATEMGLGDYSSLASRAYARLLTMQNRDGGFDYSRGDYGVLCDRRSYPRNQAMILKHLLLAVQ